MPATGLEQLPDPIPSAQMTLVEQLTEWARLRIDERVFRAGMRMPSIRQLATEKSISRFTVVEAYERLVALGYLESRRGSGFYVRERTPLASTVAPPATPRSATSMSPGCCAACSIRPRATRRPAGASCPTNGWMGTRVGRAAQPGPSARQPFPGQRHAAGFLPLRQQLRTRLEELEIGVTPDQIVMTSASRRRST
jgi:DNA-binding transcriptional MocR family regulator